jgi:hypothetical protein
VVVNAKYRLLVSTPAEREAIFEARTRAPLANDMMIWFSPGMYEPIRESHPPLV